MQQISGNTLLTSGKSTIDIEDYEYVYNDNSMRISSSYGRLLSQAELQQNNVPAFVLNILQQDVLLDEEARLMKIGVSEKEIAKAIGSDQFFYQDGAFSRSLFFSYLQQINVTEEDSVRFYAAEQKRQQLIMGTVFGIKTPEVFDSAYQIYQQETRSADFLTITPKNVASVAEPDQTTLEAWFNQNQSQFQAPEYRKISLIKMDIASLSNPDKVTDEEVKNYYNQNISAFSVPEKRTIELLRFQTRDEADAAAAKLKNGTNFEEIVTEQKKTLADINSGSLSKADFPSTYSNDIFALKPNEISAVINDLQGPVILRLVNIQPSIAKPFESVAQEIRKIVADIKAVQEINANYTSIEDSRFEGLSLAEVAKQYNIPLREITIDAQGTTPTDQKLDDLPEQATLIDTVFQATEDTDLDPIVLKNGGYVWYHVDEIIPTHNKRLDEAHDAAVAAWKAEELQRRLDEKANEVLTELKNGTSIDTLAASLKENKQSASLLQRGKSDAIFGSNGVNAVFSGPKNYMASTIGTDINNRLVFVVTETIEPLNTSSNTLPLDEKNNLNAIMVQDLSSGLLDYALEQHPVSLNNKNYDIIINR